MIKFIIIFIFILFISYIFLYDTNVNDINEKNNTLPISKHIYKENQIPIDSSAKRDKIINDLSDYIDNNHTDKDTSDISTINEDIILGTQTIHKEVKRIPGENLSNINIEEIMEDATLTNEEKSRLIDDKVYYESVMNDTSAVQTTEGKMRKMIEEDSNLYLNNN